MNFIITTHPLFPKFKEKYYQGIEDEKAPWEKKEFIENAKQI